MYSMKHSHSWNHPFPHWWLRIHLLASPLHLPVVRAPSQGLSAENLSPEVEAFRMVWWVEVLSPHRGLTTSIWQLHMAIHSVGVHGGFEANWRERMHFSEDSGPPLKALTLFYILFHIVEYDGLTFQQFSSCLWFLVNKSHCCYRGCWENKDEYIKSGIKSSLQSSTSKRGSSWLICTRSFCIYLEVDEEGRVEGGLKLHVHRDGERGHKGTGKSNQVSTLMISNISETFFMYCSFLILTLKTDGV